MTGPSREQQAPGQAAPIVPADQHPGLFRNKATSKALTSPIDQEMVIPPVPADVIARQQRYLTRARELVESEGKSLSADELESKRGALKAAILAGKE